MLLAKNFNAIDLSINGIQGNISKALSYCEKDIVDFWLPTLLKETKKYFLHQISSFADYIAKNSLSQYVDLFIEDDKLIYNCSSTYQMLAMTKHSKAKDILKNILTYTRKTLPDNIYSLEYPATCLMLLGDEYGMQYFRERLSGGDPSYEDMGREVALWGNRAVPGAILGAEVGGSCCYC